MLVFGEVVNLVDDMIADGQARLLYSLIEGIEVRVAIEEPVVAVL